MKRALFVILSILIMASCHRHPDYVIGEKEMEDLLVDIHKAEAVIESNYNIYNNNATKKKLREAVFLRHGVTQEQFDTTLVWYGHHIDKYMEIYDRVAERLRAENEEAKKLLAEENCQSMTQAGDSVDVWKQKRFHLFDSRLPSNLLTFDIATDENFRIRDYFELRFKVLMLPELNVKPQVYMAVRHANNDLAYNWVDVEKEGWCTLSVQADSAKSISRVFGYIVLPMQLVPEKMYVDSLTLIRRHYNDRIPAVDNQKTFSDRPLSPSERKPRLLKKWQ